MYSFVDDKNKKIGYVKENRLIEIKDIKEDSIVHSIYKGRVEREDKSLGGYIVNFKKNETCLLRYKDSKGNHKGNDVLIIEIIHDYLGEKIPLASERYSIAGDYIVLSEGKGVSFSRKIVNKSDKDRLKSLIYEKDFNIKFRTKAITSSRTDILDEIDQLKEVIINIKNQLNFLPIPDLIYKNDNIVYEYIKEKDLKCIVNSKKRYRDLSNLQVELDEDFSIDMDSIINSEYRRLTNREVKFSQSNLIVDKLEALTVIDVNKKNAYRKLNKKEAGQKVNIDSCMEIGNVISIRNIGGIVIIDFINTDKKGKSEIIKELHKSLQFFDLRYKINGFTRSDLCEILIFRKK